MNEFLEQKKVGKFSPLPEEIKDAREEAIEAKRDPDAAEKSFIEKFRRANTLIQEAKREKMLESLHKSIERIFKEQNN